MLILALDIATRTGICHGEAGTVPVPFYTTLRKPLQPPDRNADGIALYLRDWFERHGKPHLLVVEQFPVPVWQSSSNEVVAAQQAHGAARGVSACYGVRYEPAATGKVRKLFCGHGSVPKERRDDKRGGVSGTKNMVIDAAIARGFLAHDDRDHDKADASALFFYASVVWGGKTPDRPGIVHTSDPLSLSPVML
jgi:hypothetical protein